MQRTAGAAPQAKASPRLPGAVLRLDPAPGASPARRPLELSSAPGRRTDSPLGFHTGRTLHILLGKEHREILAGDGAPSASASYVKPLVGVPAHSGQQIQAARRRTQQAVWTGHCRGPPPTPMAQGLCAHRHVSHSGPSGCQGCWQPPRGVGGSGPFPESHLPWAGSGSSLRFSEGSKVLWGFLSCFFCLFLDRTSTLPSSSSRARLLRAAPFSLLPSLGLKWNGSGRSWGHPVAVVPGPEPQLRLWPRMPAWPRLSEPGGRPLHPKM